MKILFRYLIITLALGFMVMMTLKLWPQIQRLEFELHAMPTVASLTLLIILFMLDAYGWLLVLSTLNHFPSKLASIRIWLLSSVMRYLPGGIWSYISRAEMTCKQGVDLPSISVALYLETILVAASAFTIGLPSLIITSGYQPHCWQVIMLAIVTMLILHPSSLGQLHRIPGRIGASFTDVCLPSFLQIIKLYAYYLSFWILFGMAFVLFVDMLHPLSAQYWLPIGSTISMSFFAGFVMIFIPGGIGVRESVLYLLLEPLISAPGALLVSLGSRIWIMAAEAISLALIEALFQTQNKRSRNS